MMNTSALKKTVQNKRLLTKKDFLNMSFDFGVRKYGLAEIKKMKVSQLRELFKLTHSIDGNFKDMRGNCFSCLTSLRHDYTSKFDKNYCIDCL